MNAEVCIAQSSMFCQSAPIPIPMNQEFAEALMATPKKKLHNIARPSLQCFEWCHWYHKRTQHSVQEFAWASCAFAPPHCATLHGKVPCYKSGLNSKRSYLTNAIRLWPRPRKTLWSLSAEVSGWHYAAPADRGSASASTRG